MRYSATKKEREPRDLRLIALGARLAEIQERLKPVGAEHSRLSAEAYGYAYDMTGLGPDSPVLYGDERFVAALKEMEERTGFLACDLRLRALHRELDQVLREIMGSPATSVAGLRVKTQAAIEMNGQLWDEVDTDLNLDAQAVRSLIEAACAVTGITVPREELDDRENPILSALQHRGSASIN